MLPSPAYPLDNSCSTLFNNTLYEYMSTAFQSLPIVHGAQWSNLSMGVPVEGGVCVKSTPKNDTSAAALYIVGGTSNSSDYPGLQRYTFANQSWETIAPSVAVTQNRLYHAAVYLNTSDSILVYAGTQDGTKQLSSQTFTIQASWPYTVLAYEAIAPPAISPMLMQWTESKAIYIGGSETNTKAMVFSPSESWVDSNATLANPIYNTSAIKAVVINGDDSSKTLYTFDMAVSPNAVNRTILIDADGNPVQNAAPVVGKRWEDSSFWERSRERMKRGDLTVADWPAYNDTFALMSTRTTYTLSQDQSGLVVISGGSTTDVLCMFKARDNCWENATSVLATKTVSTSSADGLGSSPSASVSSTSTTAATSSAAASISSGDAAFPTKILGAVLGSILAVAFILIAFLTIFRWRKNRRQYSEAGHQRRASGIPDEKNAMDFADKGLPQMVTTRQFPGHEQQNSQGSFSSMAILMGRVGHKRGDENNGSVGSDLSSQYNKYKTAISKPISQEEMFQLPTHPLALPNRDEKAVSFAAKDVAAAEEREAMPRPRGSTKGGRRGSTRRSSGWNRYWSGGSSLNILGFGSKRTTYEGSDRSSDSEYSIQRMPSQVTQQSALVPPLKLGERPELNRVMSGSPTIAYQSNKFPLSGEMSGQPERTSVSTLSSYNDDRHDAFSSGIPASVHEQNTWTPVEGQGWGRASNYSESVYATTLPRSTGNYQRETRFPGSGAPPQRPPPPPQDMSWLNLGGETRI
ncbi:hypothetical protein BDZ45DRAFT_274408 [Acephala macrosclerotiorum]|nr:hypothetical protein BDZ45DRAFT_274408 [Acephala macrosclerotiorum]